MTVEYDYTGERFTATSLTGGGQFTDSEGVTGYIVLDAELPPSAISKPDIVAYGFGDGRDTILSTDFPSPFLSGGQLTTDASGQIVSANLIIFEPIGSAESGDSKGISITQYGDSGSIYDPDAGVSGIASSDSEGTWMMAGSTQPPAPLPQMMSTQTDNGTSSNLVGDNNNDVFIGTTGNDTITTGTGHNLIGPGSGNDIIFDHGSDVIFPETGGSETIFAFGPVLAAVGAGKMAFVNGSNPSTVLGGGSGSTIINAGAGGGLYAGGTGGENVIIGGSGACTMFGSSGSDLLAAGGSAANLLIAGSGNETLTGVGSTGANVMYAGSGNDLLGGGAGNETFFAGHGNATVIGGTGADLYGFVNGLAGGTETVFGFNTAKGDLISLQGYGPNELQNDLASQVVAGGNTTLTLSDHTQVTFVGVTGLNTSAFA